MTLNTAGKHGHSPADNKLTMAVCDALMRYTPIRIWGHNVDVAVHAGTVILSGVARSRAARETAEKLARGVRGVTSVENRIVVDNDVEVAVAQALASDPRTRAGFPGILIGVVFGVAYLKGMVRSAEIKDAATGIVSRVAGVQHVSNELMVAA